MLRQFPFFSAFLIAIALLMAALTLTTQYLYHQIQYPVWPTPWGGWHLAFSGYASKPVLLTWFALQGAAATLSFAVFAMLFKKLRRNKPTSDMHGTARFATANELDDMGMFDGQGVFVGGMIRGDELRYLRHNGPEHMLMVAPTRSGKGVSVVVPTLLTWPSSAFVIDIKGELWGLASGWRSSEAHNRCIRLDLTDPNGPRFNPLDTISINTSGEIADIQNLVTLLVDPLGKGMDGADGHWRKAAHALLTGLVCYALHMAQREGRIATLADVAELISPANFKFNQVLAAMVCYSAAEDESPDAETLIRSAARQQRERVGEEAASVLSTTSNYLALYRDPVLARVTSSSDFTADSLMNDDRPITVFLVINPADKSRLQPVTRLIISTIIRRLTIGMEFANGKAQSGHKRRLLLMLDEFAALGPLEIISETIAYMASFGIKTMLIVQDFSQLWSLYTRDEKLSGNCHIQVAFAPNRIETAEKFSSMTGTTTVVKQEKLHQTSISLMAPTDDRFSEVSRPLMTPDEIMRMAPAEKSGDDITAPGEMLIFLGGSHPVKGVQPLYFLDPVLRARAQIEPPESPVYSDTCLRLFEPGQPPPSTMSAILSAGKKSNAPAALPPTDASDQDSTEAADATATSGGADQDTATQRELALSKAPADGAADRSATCIEEPNNSNSDPVSNELDHMPIAVVAAALDGGRSIRR